jgi:hypothetical protein
MTLRRAIATTRNPTKKPILAVTVTVDTDLAFSVDIYFLSMLGAVPGTGGVVPGKDRPGIRV